MFNEEERLEKPLRWGMAGGGRGSQIGYIHRNSAARDGLFHLVAGAFDVDPERGAEFGRNIGVEESRCYPDYLTMLQEESRREDGIEVLSVATPNRYHYEMTKAALEHGLHVICEKPLTLTVSEAEELRELARAGNRIVGVTYGYSGHQMLHQARNMIARGDIGDVRIINMQFAHGWHTAEVEANDPGTRWRVTPATAGSTYVLGDVGTHAYYLAELLIPDLQIESLMCTRQSFIPSRAPLEDNAFVLMHFTNGAVGNLWASCVNAGSMHDQRIRVIGSRASLEWCDEHPNQLHYEVQGEPKRILDRGHSYNCNEDPLVSMDRLGGGHAVGLFESWANIYHRFGLAMDRANRGEQVDTADFWYPDIKAGLTGVRLLEKCVESADNGAVWVAFGSNGGER